MLSVIRTIFNVIFFSTIVLILGNRIYWGGRTISDQVRIGMAHAERSDILQSVRSWAERLAQDARKGFMISPNSPQVRGADDIPENITPSERSKLRALIQELNRTHQKD